MTESAADDIAVGERLIEVRGVSKRYRLKGETVHALRDVDLDVFRGEYLSIMGPSGSGKSTLFNVIGALDRPTDGRVQIGPLDLTRLSSQKLAYVRCNYIGYVFQAYNLIASLTALKNVALPRVFLGATPEEADRVAAERLEQVGLGHRVTHRPGELSGGQQQRVAIGRAIVRDPVLFLFDEPLSNLDAKLRVQTRVEIKRLLRRFRITAIYVTHDQVEAITLGTKIAVMNEGRVMQVGTYQELVDAPATAFVAGFLGQPPMNLFAKGTVRGDAVCWENAEAALPAAVRSRVEQGQLLTVGARAERAEILGPSDPAGRGLVLRGNIANIEPDFGRGTQLIYLQSGPFLYAARGPLDASLELGDEMRVVYPEDALHFFGGEPGADERRLPG
jgi:ABC-type sugar transport system ATPase subunit